jgi:phosphoserine phosphatase
MIERPNRAQAEGKYSLPALEKTRAIDELMQELLALKQQKSRLDDEANQWAEKRDKLNEQARNLRIEIECFRNERDKINNNVGQLKQQRNDFSTEIHENVEEIVKLSQETRALLAKKPSRSHQSLQNEVEDIEWKIQTTSLELKEEKELVEQVKQLETQLNVYRKLEQLTRRIVGLKGDVKKFKNESDLCHRKLVEDAQKSRDVHEKMLTKIEESKKIKADADNLHKEFLDVREKATPIRNKIAALLGQIRQLRGEIQEDELKEKKQIEDALRETLQKQALEKLKQGKKLSWEEFQLIAEKEVTAED